MKTAAKSTIDEAMEKQVEFLRQYRRLYLKSVGDRLGIGSDLAEIAQREAAEMIELARILRLQHRAPDEMG